MKWAKKYSDFVSPKHTHYHNGEKITANRMEDEDWYPAWQHCCTLKTSGPINRERPSFYERVPNGFSKLIKICKKRLAEWQENPIEDVRLKRWIKAMWMTTSQISEIEKLYNSESNKE